MSWELVAGLIPWLFLLACPLSMWWMMRGMSHGDASGKTDDAGEERLRLAVVPARNTEDEIQELKARLARLEAEGQTMEGWK